VASARRGPGGWLIQQCVRSAGLAKACGRYSREASDTDGEFDDRCVSAFFATGGVESSPSQPETSGRIRHQYRGLPSSRFSVLRNTPALRSRPPRCIAAYRSSPGTHATRARTCGCRWRGAWWCGRVQLSAVRIASTHAKLAQSSHVPTPFVLVVPDTNTHPFGSASPSWLRMTITWKFELGLPPIPSK
jgi:hypothetical protein